MHLAAEPKSPAGNITPQLNKNTACLPGWRCFILAWRLAVAAGAVSGAGRRHYPKANK